MVTKRDLVIAVLCTFCLTSALLTILPSGSNYKTSGSGEYDPWVDLDGDGVIDSTDSGMLGAAWGTYGDPTRNVNVTNWPLDEHGNLRIGNSQACRPTLNLTLAYNQDCSSGLTCSANVAGYTQVCVYVFDNSGTSMNVQISFSTPILGVGFANSNLNGGQTGYWRLDVQGPQLNVVASAVPGTVTICVYAL